MEVLVYIVITSINMMVKKCLEIGIILNNVFMKNKVILKPIKRTLRNAGFVLDDFATHIDKKQLSFRHPYVYTGMAIAAVGVMIANKHYGFGLY